MYAQASEWGINSIISCVWALWDIAWLLKYLPGVLHGLQFSGMLLYVTGFAKRGLIHASNFSTLEVCNLPHV